MPLVIQGHQLESRLVTSRICERSEAVVDIRGFWFINNCPNVISMTSDFLASNPNLMQQRNKLKIPSESNF